MKTKKEPPNAAKKQNETLSQIYQASMLLILFTIQMITLHKEMITLKESKYLIDFLQVLVFLTAAWLIFLIVILIINRIKSHEKNRSDKRTK